MKEEKTTNASQESRKSEKKEIKGKLSNEQLRSILSQWISALDQRKPFDFSVEGQSCHVPADALEQGNAKIEYEVGDGEYELELKLKWKEAQQKTEAA